MYKKFLPVIKWSHLTTHMISQIFGVAVYNLFHLWVIFTLGITIIMYLPKYVWVILHACVSKLTQWLAYPPLYKSEKMGIRGYNLPVPLSAALTIKDWSLSRKQGTVILKWEKYFWQTSIAILPPYQKIYYNLSQFRILVLFSLLVAVWYQSLY